MRTNQIYLIIVLSVFIAVVSIYHYVFSIYEVTYKITPEKLYADNKSTMVIEVMPVNALGWKAPFRSPTKPIRKKR